MKNIRNFGIGKRMGEKVFEQRNNDCFKRFTFDTENVESSIFINYLIL